MAREGEDRADTDTGKRVMWEQERGGKQWHRRRDKGDADSDRDTQIASACEVPLDP